MFLYFLYFPLRDVSYLQTFLCPCLPPLFTARTVAYGEYDCVYLALCAEGVAERCCTIISITQCRPLFLYPVA